MEQIYKKINRYLQSEKNTPIIVDVPNTSQLMELKYHYDVSSNVIIKASEFCEQDSFPNLGELYNELSKNTENVFLTELSTFLRLQGQIDSKRILREILDLNIEGKLVIITHQCRKLLDFEDKRFFDSGRIILCEGEEEKQPNLVFFNYQLTPSVEPIYNGIEKLPGLIEEDISKSFFIKTKFTKHLLPNSLISFKEIGNSFELLTIQFPAFKDLDINAGEDEQWNYLVGELNKTESFESFVQNHFGGIGNLIQCLSKFSLYNLNEQWALFIALKLYGVGNDKYMNAVLRETTNFDSFIKRLFVAILEFDFKKSEFNEVYNSRKKYLIGFTEFTSQLTSFCHQVESKGIEGLNYLTDNTQQEKELIIQLIVENKDKLDKDKVKNQLRLIYPDLFYYLQPYHTGINLIDSYFELYKYCKVTNQISPAMQEQVENQAINRDYNKDLRPRSLIIDKADKRNSILYFVDALGVEFLSFIQQICFDKKIKLKIEVARCELPSITAINKEFVDSFKDAGCPVIDVKDIDELKHHAPHQFNYQFTKLPIHIVEELRIVKKLIIENITADLNSGKYDKVYIVSDHGASRLAVINEHENKIVAEEKGEHSGRCCLKSDISEKPENATDESGYWCIANYDQFKGGRKTGVEVHGGATIEEVSVPIIELSLSHKTIETYISRAFLKIAVSFRKKARIEFFAEIVSDDITVQVDGHEYEAKETDTKYIYSVEMPEVVKAGIHQLDIKVKGNIIAQGLEFEVKKEGTSERKFF